MLTNINSTLWEYQQEIVTKVCENIKKGNKMQTIILPNGGGKTSLAIILSIMFSQEGKKVLYYRNRNTNLKKTSIAREFGADISNFEKVDYGNTKSIKGLFLNCYDIIITDSISSAFSSEVLADFNHAIRDIDTNKEDVEMEELSTAEQSLIGLHYLQQMIERDDSFVVYFIVGISTHSVSI